MRSLGGRERTESLQFPVDRDPRPPPLGAGLFAHAKELGGVMASCLPQVLRVDCPAGVSQVRQAVVLLDAIAVVYLTGRPFPVGIEPRKPIEAIRLSIHTRGQVSILVREANDGADWSASVRLGPREHARRLVVVQKLAKARNSKIGSSHITSQTGYLVRASSVLQHLRGSLIFAG